MHPKVCVRAQFALGTLRLRNIYTSVGVTSTFVLSRIEFPRFKRSKQSVQCRFSTM